jgi:MOSC domain-containing protein
MPTGTVSRLWRWPVKSMAGEEVRALSLGPRGAGGDRVHAVLHHHKGEWRPLTAREAPRLLAWRAAYPFNLDAGLDPAKPPHAIVTEPSGERSWRWGDPRLRAALERDLGRAVQLERDTGGIPDVPGTVLLTVAGSLAALSRELGTEVDARRFRTNLHLELDAEPWAELGWAGAVLELEGGVRLRVDGACERCAIPTRDPETQEKWPRLLAHLAAEHGQDFGLLARVTAVGRVAAGEQVRIVTS